MSTRLRNVAKRRLKRDLVELQRENILSIAAHPIDNNIFEWHVNIKPTDGIYSGVYFHLIMVFPDSYPSNPPTVKICTPIRHPNIFDSFLCLSMLRSHTGNVPYEGWSGAYSATSVLMQLQSFLFAEKIDQDGGYQANARLSDKDVNKSLAICKQFKCTGTSCKHSHNTPWPLVKGPPESLIKVFPTDAQSGHVVVQGSSCQTTHTYWVGAYGEFGCNYGKIMYECFINWTGDRWAKNNIRGGLCRFGFGSERADVCGRSVESFGYGGTGMFSYDNQFNKFGQSFTKNDTITVAVDFDTQRIYFCKNGKIMEAHRKLYIPQYLQGVLLYPILSFKNSRAEFNFGPPKKPCKFLMQNGFQTLEQIVLEQGNMDGEENKNDTEDLNNHVDWHSEYIISDLWLFIFESLQVPEIFSTKFVCKKWHELINKYNIIERNELYCYYSKRKLGETKGGKILGIGLDIKQAESGYGFEIKSQMDILSLNAWRTGCRIGVWGEHLTHFLPLVMNKCHSEIADTSIKHYLQLISKMIYNSRGSNANEFERFIERTNCLKLVDTLVTMMNQIVVQFVMGTNDKNTNAKQVSMVMCEKVVLGYCALHHLLLYLQSQNKKIVTNFANNIVKVFIQRDNGSNKSICRDLGKFLIYLMICSKYEWCDVANLFIFEVFTRNVRWMVQESKYSKYDSTKCFGQRVSDTFIASKISRRLVMFQVWFMKNNSHETLLGYNNRLGRPQYKVRNGVVAKTKFILNSKSWSDYFNELDVTIKNEKTIDKLLRFAVYNSKQKGYHRNNNNLIKKVNPPHIKVNKQLKSKKYMNEGLDDNSNKIGLKSGRGRGCANVKGSGWRGRGRGGKTIVNQRGRGRGLRGKGPNNQSQHGMTQTNNNNNNNHNNNNNINRQEGMSKSQRRKRRKYNSGNNTTQ